MDLLSQASAEAVTRLPEPLALRASHVLGENERVREAVAALRHNDLAALGRLLDASHASLRDRYEIDPCGRGRRRAAASRGSRRRADGGWRLWGGILGLFAPDAAPPADTLEVRPSAGARLLQG